MFLLAPTLLLSWSCASVRHPSDDPLGVYTAILARFVAPGAVVDVHTHTPPSEAASLPKDLPDGLRSEFIRVAWGPEVLLTPGLELPVGITTVRAEQLYQLLEPSHGSGPELERRYPGANGLVQFSRVAFDRAQGTALVFFSHSRASMVGSGSLLLLRWKSGAWHIEKQVSLWVA